MAVSCRHFLHPSSLHTALLATSLALSLLGACTPSPLLDNSISGEQIQQYLKTQPQPADSAEAVLKAFYEARQYLPAWTSEQKILVALQAIEQVDLHGLNPVDYHLPELQALDKRRHTDIAAAIQFDVLLSEAVMRYLDHLRYGKVDPVSQNVDWNLRPPTDTPGLPEVLAGLVSAPDFATSLSAAIPTDAHYRTLQHQLVKYIEATKAGGWPTVTDGPLLKPGARDPRIAAVRQRLDAEDEGLAPSDDDTFYDDALVAAVKHFQVRHGIEPDGKIGPATLRELNTSADERVDQLRVNLERARWLFRHQDDTYVIVNIAGYRAQYIENGEIRFSGAVVVGRPYRQSPMFSATISYLVLNPTWTVPPTILKKDTLPKIAADTGYLAANQMDVRNDAGQIIDPATIDWQDAARRGYLPYQLVQRPGAHNALGRIKFMFPNAHSVYLHDTPNKELFGKAERANSSGCIRLQNPLDLATLLLARQEGWDRTRLEAEIATGTTKTVNLTRPVAILLAYWTVQPGPGNSITFYPDIYGRDAAVLAALKQRHDNTP